MYEYTNRFPELKDFLKDVDERLRLCEWCDGLIPPHKNWNTKYCCDECYDNNKAVLAKDANRQKAREQLLIRNEEVVADLYQIYGSAYYISAKYLIDKNFNWSIYSAEVNVQNLPAKKLITYGYTLFTNQTVQPWKF